MTKLVRTLMKEQGITQLQAEIYSTVDNTYLVKYFVNGLVVKEETSEKFIHIVESNVQTWLDNVKPLNG
jgi:hypothetical protein